MNRRWAHVSIDEERKIPAEENYRTFQDILNTVTIPEVDVDFFDHTDRSTPIPSYGVILVYDSVDKFEYFCLQARTTIEFAELVRRGPRKECLYEYLHLMTNHERYLLKTYSHEVLWDSLLLNEKDGYARARARAETLFNTYKGVLPTLIDLINSDVDSAPWCFPKGRKRNADKTLLQTAIRELEEEGKIKLDEKNLLLMDECSQFDMYKGSDGVKYCTTYYVLKSPERYNLRQRYFGARNVVSEFCLSNDMQNYAWISIDKNAEYSEIQTCLIRRLHDLLCRVHAKLCDMELNEF